jgi:hypothetical protein
MTDCPVMKIDKKSMNEVLHREHAFSDMFVGYLLARNIRYEEDLVDQLFNSGKKRLARVLLLLAHFGKEGKPEAVPQDESGDPSRNDRYNPVARQFFHEQVPEVRLHRLRRRKRLASSQCTSQHHSQRLEPRFRKQEVYSLIDSPLFRGHSATAPPS